MRWIGLLLLAIGAPWIAWAQPAFHADPTIDCGGIERILELPDSAWQTGSGALADRDMRFVQLWVRLQIADRTPQVLMARYQYTPSWFLYAASGDRIGFVSVFEPDTLGDYLPGMHVIGLPSEPQLVYACLAAPEPRPTEVHLLTVDALRAWESRDRLLIGLPSGAMLAMASLALAFAVRLRESMFFLYTLYSVSFLAYLIYYIDGLRALFPRPLQLVPLSMMVGTLITWLAAAAGVRFALQFNELPERWPRVSRLIQRALQVAAIGALGMVCAFAWWRDVLMLPSAWAFNGAIGVAVLVLLAALAQDAVRGRYAARIFLLGWSPIMVLVLFAVLASLELGSKPPVAALFMAATFECLVLGYAIAERAWRFRAERDQARRDAERDALTGSLNRAALMRALALSAGRRPATLLYCDLDHFKRINDEHGHVFGDRCLKHFAQLAREQLRGIDAFGRIGGEEFVAVLPGTDLAEAARTAERLRAALEQAPIDGIRLTVSIGVAESLGEETSEAWMERADRALYRAKREGRNRIALDGATA